MKFYPSILFYIIGQLAIVTLFGQSRQEDTHYTDSMERLIHAASQDTVKVTLLSQLSDYWSEKDSGKAVSYAKEAIAYSKGHTFYAAKARFYYAGAYFYYDSIKSKQAYRQVIEVLKNDPSKRSRSLLSRSWQNYGALLQRSGNDKAYMRILLDHVIPLARSAGDTLREANGYADVAMVFSNILNYKKALFYYRKAIDQAISLRPPPKELASFYIRMAKNYIYDGQTGEAKTRLDSSWHILSGKSHYFEHADYFMVLGMYYAGERQWEQAFHSLDSALVLAKALNLPYLANGILFQKYKAYAGAKRFSMAKKTLLRVYHDTLSESKPANRLMLLYNLARTDARMNHMKDAYNWLLQYTTVVDSLHHEELKSQISGLEIKFESGEKQREILTLQNQNNIQKLTLPKRRFINYVLITGIFILLLIVLIIYIFYNNKRKKAFREAKLYQQQLKQIETDHQLNVYNAMLQGQEQERQRMARDLHDGLGGMLAGVKLKLSDIAAQEQRTLNTGLDKAILQLDHSVQELRRIAHNMMPETLLRFGVETALRDLCNSLQTPATHIDFQAIQLDKNLSQNVQIAIYRIIQELLTNAVKHAKATDILVQCSQNEDRIFITVEDDGRGFDIKAMDKGKGIGMVNIRKRIDYLKGNIDIDSQTGEGTVVNVEVNAYE